MKVHVEAVEGGSNIQYFALMGGCRTVQRQDLRWLVRIDVSQNRCPSATSPLAGGIVVNHSKKLRMEGIQSPSVQ